MIVGIAIGVAGGWFFFRSRIEQQTARLEERNIFLEREISVKAEETVAERKRGQELAEKLAEVKETSLAEIAAVTTANARALFGI